MSTRSSLNDVVSLFSNSEQLLRRRIPNRFISAEDELINSFAEPSLSFDMSEHDDDLHQPAPPMGDQFWPMEELLQAPTEGFGDAIVVPAVLANQFELKIGLLNLVSNNPFHGFVNDDPHSHIRRFIKLTQTLKLNQVPRDVVKLILFPFSLEGATQKWLEKEPLNSITTWDDLVSKFVNQFYPSSKTTNLRNYITQFQQAYTETFSEAWERLKGLLWKCPHHGFSPLHQIDTFYNGLNQSDQDSLNSAAGGNLLS